jgi:hypothetical protein
MKSISDSKQPLILYLQGRLIISFDHEEIEQEGLEGKRTAWQCEQVLLKEIPTRKNIISAIKAELFSEQMRRAETELAELREGQSRQQATEAADWKDRNPYPQSDAAEQTNEQKAYWLAFVEFHEALKQYHEEQYENKRIELTKEVDCTDKATKVANEVINFLNQ